MNYSVLYPKVLNNLPPFNKDDFLLNSISETRKTNIYIPHGRKYLLWFTKLNNQNYSFLIELYQNKAKSVKFKYISFKDELTCGKGTLIYGTLVNDEFCCEKIIYNNGFKNKSKNFMQNLDDIKLLIEYYIKNIDLEYFLTVKIPYINHSNNPILDGSNLAYRVYQIRQNNNSYINFLNITCNFKIIPINVIKDVYELQCYNNKNEIIKYDNAFVNDFKTSCLLNRYFKKLKNYKDIEFSDDEDSNNEENEYLKEYAIISCIFIPHKKKWKPYFFNSSKNINNLKEIKVIENKFLNKIKY